MKPALLLVDLQRHFLDGPGLSPAPNELIDGVAKLLMACRDHGLMVLHAHTLVRPDGSDRMPHWKRAGTWGCVEGSPDSLPPPVLLPREGEPVFRKRFFSAFGNPDLDNTLMASGVDTLIIAGLYLHACVRSSVMDAYEHGYEVWLADEAVATTDPVHGELTRGFLEGRAATCLNNAAILERLGAMDVNRCLLT